MLAASIISAMSVNFYQTTRHINLEDSHPHTRRRDNLKSHYNPFVLLDLPMTYSQAKLRSNVIFAYANNN
jgi:hypothetical protein